MELDPQSRPVEPVRPSAGHFTGQTGRFFGRDHDIEKVGAMLRDPLYRLVTLAGAGGIGKTRLAFEVARSLRDHFEDGVHVVLLQPVQSAEYLMPAIMEALEVTPHSSGDLVTQLQRYLADRNTLLVLDNFEHLLEGVGGLTRLLEAAPHLKILVTSREVLNLSME